MRIAIVGLRAPFDAEGGVEHVVGAVAPRLAAAGCDVTVYCRTRYNRHGEAEINGVRLRNLETIYSKHLEAIVHTARALPEAAREHDLVHIHALGPAILSFLPRIWNCPTIVSVHGLDWKRAKWGWFARTMLQLGERSANRFADRITVVSDELRQHFQDEYGIETTAIPNGADLPDGNGSVKTLERFGLKAGQFHLYLGRIVPEKNLSLLIKAHATAEADWPLVIVGGHTHADQHYAELKASAHESVVFLGPRYGEEKSALLGNAGSFCLASNVEGFPVALLEAMATGRPCLVSDLPPHREIFPSPDHGAVILPTDDPVAWAAAIRTLESTPEGERTISGQNARRRVENAYSWDATAKATLKVYREVLGLSSMDPTAPQAP